MQTVSQAEILADDELLAEATFNLCDEETAERYADSINMPRRGYGRAYALAFRARKAVRRLLERIEDE